jgi:hypothetical protein
VFAARSKHWETSKLDLMANNRAGLDRAPL